MNATKKCITVIDRDLPLGLIANTAAILGCTLGRNIQEIVGENTMDCHGYEEPGIINIPLPILAAGKEKIRELYLIIRSGKYKEKIEMISFSNLAQHCTDYEDYKDKMAAQSGRELDYLGLCLYGEKKAINQLTGNLPTLK